MKRGKSPVWALRRGQKLARSGRTEPALAAFEAAGESGDCRLFVQHALALGRAGRGEEALSKSALAAASAPEDVVPAIFNAYLLMKFGRIEAAAEEVERAKGLSPGHPLAESLSAALDLVSGRAAEGCRKLLDGPVTDNLEVLGWVLALVERRIFESVGTDSGALPPEPAEAGPPESVPEDVPALSASACARKGRRLLESGRPKGAAKYLARAVELKPEDAESRATLGAALFEAGEFERAETELSLVPAKSPLAGVAQFYRAANAYRMGRHEEAMRLIDSLPQKGDVVLYREWFDYIRGMALVALGRPDEAAGRLAVFIDSDPLLLERRLRKALEILSKEAGCCTSC